MFSFTLRPMAEQPRKRERRVRTRSHTEEHTHEGVSVRDVILGVSDGLTVPFALAAGLSGAEVAKFTVFLAGVAEMLAGGIAMGLGGYLSEKSHAQIYQQEFQREHWEVERVPEQEKREVREIWKARGYGGEELERLVEAIIKDRHRWVDFMMREELGLVAPAAGAALQTSLTIGLSYVVGALVPLFPFLLPVTVQQALGISSVTTLTTLFLVGLFKSHHTGGTWWRNGLETMLIGAAAAGAAYLLVRVVSQIA
jgi:VIT1/CCC1 family predicted Fe2+/Mn2+ transporter